MIGSQVQHYKILEKLGAGGMGVVYLAEDTKLKRNVALKFLPESYSNDSNFRTRFEREATAAARLNQPNVVTIYEFGEFEEKLFIAMENIEGRSLGEYIQSEDRSLEKTISYFKQICQGLTAAHEAAIIHRDLKPSNILIEASTDRVVIIDFGLAQLASESRLTAADKIAGTLANMSPEQIEIKPIDHRTDIFSLGVILYEALSGRPPFIGDYHLATMYSIVHAEPQSLSEIDASIPTYIIDIAYKCMRKSPDERFADCNELISALQESDAQGGVVAGLKQKSDSWPSYAFPKEKFGKRIFVGRKEQVEEIERGLDRTKSGLGGVFILSGEAGVGKSRLAAEAVEGARGKKFNVFWGRCNDLEADLSYRPFLTALKFGFMSLDEHVIDALSEKANRLGIPFSGHLGAIKSFLNISEEPVELQNKEQFWEALLTLFTIIVSDRPAVLVIDDLQWAEKTTISFFSFLARNIENIPLYLIGIYREDELEPTPDSSLYALKKSVRQLSLDGFATHLPLKRLSYEDTSKIVENYHAQNPEVVIESGDVFARSSGNPLFTLELINLSLSQSELSSNLHRDSAIERVSVTERIRDILRLRLAGLEPEDRDILECASCQGYSFRSEVLITCLRINRLAALKRLQALSGKWGLIRAAHNHYEFDHPLIRDVVYSGMLAELRAEYHSIIANCLMERQADEAQSPQSIANHLLTGGRELEAVPFLLQAGQSARTLYADDEAKLHFSNALRIARSDTAKFSRELIQALEGVGDVFSAQGNSSDAARTYRELLSVSEERNDKEAIARALRKLSDAERILGQTDAARKHIEESLDLSERLGDPFLKLQSLIILGIISRSQAEDITKALSFHNDALEIANKLNDSGARALCLRHIGSNEMHQGELKNSLECLTKAFEILDNLGDTRGIAITLNVLGLTHRLLGNFEKALNSLTEAVKLMEKIGFARGKSGCINGLGDTYRDIFDLENAVKCHNESLALSLQQQNKNSQCDNLRDLGADYYRLGDFENSQRYLDECLALSQSIGNAWYETRTLITLGALHISLGNSIKADDYSKQALDLAQQIGSRELKIEAHWARALALIDAEPSDPQIKTMLDKALNSAVEGGYRSLAWQIHQELATYYSKRNQIEDSERHRLETQKALRTIAGEFEDENLRRKFLNTPKIKSALEL